MTYDSELCEDHVTALFQQKIPKTFLDLQDWLIREAKNAPVMKHDEFVATFKTCDHFENEDELKEAVYFLNLQGAALNIHEQILYRSLTICMH